MDKRIFYILTILILVTGFAARLYKINNPVADWHSWRQADTAAVARNFLKLGFDPLKPRYDDLSNIQTGFDNPKGYRMVEFPLYQILGAGVTKIFSKVPIEISLRLVTIIFSMLTCLTLIGLVSRYSTQVTGLISGFVFAVLPYSIYYGRTILPDPFMVFWAMLSLWALDTYFRDKPPRIKWFVLSVLSAAIALLVKPVAAFLLLPQAYLFLKNFRLRKSWFIKAIIFGVVTLFPLWWWRVWITQFPEGIPSYTWLFNGGNIRFKGAWFYWLFAERIGNLILGYWGLLPLGVGILSQNKKEGWFFRILLIGTILYMIVIARGNVQHDYYQILLLPVISIYVAKGLVFLWQYGKNDKIWAGILTLSAFAFMWAFSWYTVRSYYWINRPEIVEAGRIADKIIPKNAKVIAPYNGDTSFLYQTNRQGWPEGFDIAKKISMGAGYYVTVSPTDNDSETKDLANTYTVLVRNDKFAIIDLTRKK